MIVNDLDVVSVPTCPNEADPPSVVDTDAMLSLAVTFQRFQPVARGNPHFFQGTGPMEIQQLPPCDSLNGPKPRHVDVGEQRFSAP